MEVEMSELLPEDRALIEAARNGLHASEEDRLRVKRNLFGKLGLGVAAGTAATSATALGSAAASTVSIATVVKGVLAGVVLTASIGGGVLYVERTPASLPPIPAPPIAVESAPPPMPLPSAPSPTATASISVPRPEAKKRPAPSPSPTTVVPTAMASATTDPAISAPPADPVVSLPASSPSHPLPARPMSLETETRLLREAEGAMRAGDPSRALTRLDEHARSFPNGVLGEERDAQRVFAMCALGRTEQARIAAGQFTATYPHSPLRNRVQSACSAPR
jgi:hypothetical protein